MLNEKIKFEYLEHHFTPVRKLTNKELLNIQNSLKHLKDDAKLELKDYTHEGFYKACGNKDYDLFKCEENKKIYMPCDNGLFEYGN